MFWDSSPLFPRVSPHLWLRKRKLLCELMELRHGGHTVGSQAVAKPAAFLTTGLCPLQEACWYFQCNIRHAWLPGLDPLGVPLSPGWLSRAPGQTLGHCRAEAASHASGWCPHNGAVWPPCGLFTPQATAGARPVGGARHLRTTRQLFLPFQLQGASRKPKQTLQHVATSPPSYRQCLGEHRHQTDGVRPRRGQNRPG